MPSKLKLLSMLIALVLPAIASAQLAPPAADDLAPQVGSQTRLNDHELRIDLLEETSQRTAETVEALEGRVTQLERSAPAVGVDNSEPPRPTEDTGSGFSSVLSSSGIVYEVPLGPTLAPQNFSPVITSPDYHPPVQLVPVYHPPSLEFNNDPQPAPLPIQSAPQYHSAPTVILPASPSMAADRNRAPVLQAFKGRFAPPLNTRGRCYRDTSGRMVCPK